MRAVPLSPEEKHEGLEEGPKVIVLRDLEFILITVLILHVDADVAKHLGNQMVMIGAATPPVGSEKPLNRHGCLSKLGSPHPPLPKDRGPCREGSLGTRGGQHSPASQ